MHTSTDSGTSETLSWSVSLSHQISPIPKKIITIYMEMCQIEILAGSHMKLTNSSISWKTYRSKMLDMVLNILIF